MGRSSTVLCLAFFALAVTAQKGSRRPQKQASVNDGKIVGGEAADISEFPYLVGLRFVVGNEPFCGGSIISPDWILTAAHCFLINRPRIYEVFAGTTNYSLPANVRRRISSIIPHPLYDSETMDYDVALVKLSSPLILNGNVQAIALDRDEFKPTDRLLVAGWGKLSEGGESPTHLQKVTLTGVARDKCQKSYQKIGPITKNMICAGEEKGAKDSCQGDSGGPALSIFTRKQVGVVSWGEGCARPGYPGIYANVAELLPWIENHTGRLP